MTPWVLWVLAVSASLVLVALVMDDTGVWEAAGMSARTPAGDGALAALLLPRPKDGGDTRTRSES